MKLFRETLFMKMCVDTFSLIPDFIENFIETPYDAHTEEF